MSVLRNCIFCGARAVPADDGMQTCSACSMRQGVCDITPPDKKRRRRVMLGLAGLLAIALLAIGVRNVFVVALREHDGIHCSSNLRNMAQQIHIFAREHGGRLPQGWDDLPDHSGLGCTLEPRADGSPAIAYVYLGQGLDMNNLSGDRLIAYEPFPLHRRASFLYADGHVDGLTRDEALAELNRVAVQRTGTGQPKAGRPMKKTAWP